MTDSLKRFDRIFHVDMGWIGHKETAFPSIAKQIIRGLYKKMMGELIFPLPKEEIEARLEALFASSYRFMGRDCRVHWWI